MLLNILGEEDGCSVSGTLAGIVAVGEYTGFEKLNAFCSLSSGTERLSHKFSFVIRLLIFFYILINYIVNY